MGHSDGPRIRFRARAAAVLTGALMASTVLTGVIGGTVAHAEDTPPTVAPTTCDNQAFLGGALGGLPIGGLFALLRPIFTGTRGCSTRDLACPAIPYSLRGHVWTCTIALDASVYARFGLPSSMSLDVQKYVPTVGHNYAWVPADGFGSASPWYCGASTGTCGIHKETTFFYHYNDANHYPAAYRSFCSTQDRTYAMDMINCSVSAVAADSGTFDGGQG